MIDLVTLTGADDSIEPHALIELRRKYSFVEFGLLLSANNTPKGCPRFPSLAWLSDLASLLEKTRASERPPLSGHFCGEWVRKIFMGENFDDAWMSVVGTGIVGFLSRFQLNTHGIFHRRSFPGFVQRMEDLGRDGRQVIFQLDGANDGAWKHAISHASVAVLHDLSSGAGVRPLTWAAPVPGVRNGYAGGLSPDNVTTEIMKIEVSLRPTDRIWIDAETHLRSEDQERRLFDLSKAASFLQASSPYVLEDK